MTPLVAAWAAVPPALGLGSMVGVWVGMWWQHRHSPFPAAAGDADRLGTECDQDRIETQFAAHAVAVAGQVSEYADQLADGDVVLRERLRLIEQHLHRTA
ncbi:MAG: hypothetical protein ACSLEW_07580 [Nocardioides sp.]